MIYENNKDFEAKLNSLKRELDDRENGLDQREQTLAARERNVAQREKDVGDGEDELNRKKGRLKEWQYIYEIVSVLGKVELRRRDVDIGKRLLEKFFEDAKGLSPETLQDLQDKVSQFVPVLKELADADKSNNKLSNAIKDIERKLERISQSRD